MRVAVVFWDVPSDWGGNYVFTQSLLHSLRAIKDQAGHEFVFYATPPPGTEGEIDDPDVIAIPVESEEPPRGRLARRRARRSREPEAPSPTWFERSLAEQEIDLVWFASWHAEETELPYIFTVLDLEYLRQPWYPEVSAHGAWEERHTFFTRFIPRATRVIVPNEAGSDQVIRHFPIERERLLPLHHPTPPFALEAGAAEQAAADAGRELIESRGIGNPYLLYTAKFWAHKNHPTLLRALVELNRGGGDPYELVLVGTGSAWGDQLEHVEGLAKELGIAEEVHFTGYVSDEELVALYRHAFALTYVSMFGSENLPPLEAMALGCPTIVADIPGAAEQFGESALRVAPMDPPAVAAAVRQLEDPEPREKLIAAGRELAFERTPERYVGGVLEFLDQFERTRESWGRRTWT